MVGVNARFRHLITLFTILLVNSARNIETRSNILNTSPKRPDTIGSHFKHNPPSLVEGDEAIFIKQGKSRKSSYALWPNGHVDFIINEHLQPGYKVVIKHAVEHWTKNTCLQFTDRTNDKKFDSSDSNSYLYFTTSPTGCWSYVGRTGKKQEVNLDNGCQYKSVVIHEIGHSIGLFHEQSRSDRDDYVKVLLDNIIKKDKDNFLKHNTRNYDVPYDYMSIMHYAFNDFSKSKFEQNTIHSVDPKAQYMMGTAEVLSFRDRKIVNRMYKCSDECEMRSSCKNGGFINEACKCDCPPGTGGEHCQNGSPKFYDVCSGTITTAGYFKTPGYPSRPSTREERSCVYNITGPAGYKVCIKFTDFDFGRRDKGLCTLEHVEMRIDGVKSDGEFYCGTDLKQKQLCSRGRQFFILTDSYIGDEAVGKGFRALVTFLRDERNGLRSGSKPTSKTPTVTKDRTRYYECPDKEYSGIQVVLPKNNKFVITSPNYGTDRNYPNDISCEISLTAAGDKFSSLEFRLVHIDIELSSNCDHDYLELGSKSSPEKLCGTSLINVNLPQHLSSAIVRFKSDRSVTKTGFKLIVETVRNVNN